MRLTYFLPDFMPRSVTCVWKKTQERLREAKLIISPSPRLRPCSATLGRTVGTGGRRQEPGDGEVRSFPSLGFPQGWRAGPCWAGLLACPKWTSGGCCAINQKGLPSFIRSFLPSFLFSPSLLVFLPLSFLLSLFSSLLCAFHFSPSFSFIFANDNTKAL